MFITTPNTHKPGHVFRRHRLEDANGRAVRPGFDPLFITGYHQLWPGFQLHKLPHAWLIDISIAPLDAPDSIPAGCCHGYTNQLNGTRYACQQSTERPRC